MLDYNEEFDKLRSKILRYALYKKRTEKEIREKFKDAETNYVDDIIEFLIEDNYINDKEYIEAYFYDSINLRNNSLKEIKFKLTNKGIDRYMIEKYIDDNLDELVNYEINSIKLLLERRKEIEEEKNIRYLLNKGYSFENISKAIKTLGDD